MTKITPVLLSGGAGTRLWPLSRRARPKQFHALGGSHTLIQATVLRFTGAAFNPPMVICSDGHVALVREQLAQVGVTPGALILEPEGRNTAAAAAMAALAVQDADGGLVLLLSADARIEDPEALRQAVLTGAPAAEAGSLVIFGITPTGPETAYGYIRAEQGPGPVRKVAAFVEKPDLATAQAYVADPAYSWNAGIFLFASAALPGRDPPRRARPSRRRKGLPSPRPRDPAQARSISARPSAAHPPWRSTSRSSRRPTRPWWSPPTSAGAMWASTTRSGPRRRRPRRAMCCGGRVIAADTARATWWSPTARPWSSPASRTWR